jgi:hypothetical protein
MRDEPFIADGKDAEEPFFGDGRFMAEAEACAARWSYVPPSAYLRAALVKLRHARIVRQTREVQWQRAHARLLRTEVHYAAQAAWRADVVALCDHCAISASPPLRRRWNVWYHDSLTPFFRTYCQASKLHERTFAARKEEHHGTT